MNTGFLLPPVSEPSTVPSHDATEDASASLHNGAGESAFAPVLKEAEAQASQSESSSEETRQDTESEDRPADVIAATPETAAAMALQVAFVALLPTDVSSPSGLVGSAVGVDAAVSDGTGTVPAMIQQTSADQAAGVLVGTMVRAEAAVAGVQAASFVESPVSTSSFSSFPTGQDTSSDAEFISAIEVGAAVPGTVEDAQPSSASSGAPTVLSDASSVVPMDLNEATAALAAPARRTEREPAAAEAIGIPVGQARVPTVEPSSIEEPPLRDDLLPEGRLAAASGEASSTAQELTGRADRVPLGSVQADGQGQAGRPAQGVADTSILESASEVWRRTLDTEWADRQPSSEQSAPAPERTQEGFQRIVAGMADGQVSRADVVTRPSSVQAVVLSPADMPAAPTPTAVRLEVNRPGLGQVEIRVALNDQRVNASIMAEQADVGDFLKRHQGQLEARLQASGLELGEFRVDVDAQGAGSDGAAGTFGQERHAFGQAMPRPELLGRDRDVPDPTASAAEARQASRAAQQSERRLGERRAISLFA